MLTAYSAAPGSLAGNEGAASRQGRKRRKGADEMRGKGEKEGEGIVRLLLFTL